MNFLDFFFPKQCVNCGKFGKYICQDCSRKIDTSILPICPVCKRQSVGGKTHPGCAGKYKLDGLIFGASYKGPVKKAILKLKYKWVTDIGESLVDIQLLNLWRFDFEQDAVLVPIPLHQLRKNWRGFNQAELFSNLISKKYKVNVFDLLVRVKETKTQVGLTKREREENIKEAFDVRSFESLNNSTVILVDDVFTTGATMAEAAKTLKKAGVQKVWAMVVAID